MADEKKQSGCAVEHTRCMALDENGHHVLDKTGASQRSYYFCARHSIAAEALGLIGVQPITLASLLRVVESRH